MCVLLCFGDTELCLSALAQIFTQSHVQIFRRICNGYIRHCCIILCHADELYREVAVLSLKSAEIRVNKAAGQLSCTVRTEVEEYDAVVFLNGAVLIQNSRQHEFVCYVVCIAVLDCLYRISVCLYALAQNDCIVCLFYTIPCVVTIHCIVTSGNGCNLAYTDLVQLCDSILHKSSSRCRRFVTAVQECVNIHLRQTLAFCHFQQSVQMRNMAVNAARREQTHQVQCSSLFLAGIYSSRNCWIFKELSVFNVLCDLYQHLINNAACADVGVSYFRVAHLTIRQTYVQTACADQCIRSLHEFVQVRFLCSMDRIAVIAGIVAKSIHDNQCNRFFAHVVFLLFLKKAAPCIRLTALYGAARLQMKLCT